MEPAGPRGWWLGLGGCWPRRGRRWRSTRVGRADEAEVCGRAPLLWKKQSRAAASGISGAAAKDGGRGTGRAADLGRGMAGPRRMHGRMQATASRRWTWRGRAGTWSLVSMAVAGSLLLVGATKDGAEAARAGVVAGLLLTRALRRFACSGTGGHRRRGSCGRGARGRPGGGFLLAVPARTSLGERERERERAILSERDRETTGGGERREGEGREGLAWQRLRCCCWTTTRRQEQGPRLLLQFACSGTGGAISEEKRGEVRSGAALLLRPREENRGGAPLLWAGSRQGGVGGERWLVGNGSRGGFGWRRDKLPRNMGGGGGRIRWIDGTGLGFHLFI